MSYSMISPEARNIVAMFTQATTLEVERGCNWYPEAHQVAYKLGKRYNLYTDQVVGVIAALSPRNKWERNIQDAESILKAWTHGLEEDVLAVKCATFNNNKRKALDVLLGNHESIHHALNGLKMIEFFNCIAQPDVDDVCIDGHAYSIWMGVRLPLKDVPAISPKLRGQIKSDYQDAKAFINAELGEKYLTSQIQAITWVTYKRIHNV